MALNSVLGKLLFSREPKLPANERLDINAEQGKAVAGNQKVLPATETLAKDVNRFNQDQLNAAMEEASPGFRGLRDSQQGIIKSQLMGEIPKDVQDQIQNQTAARSLGGGYGSSGFGNNALARNLGLTSLEIQTAGMGNADRWMNFGRQNLIAPQYDVTSAFVKPMEQYQVDRAEANQQWNWQWMKNQMDAAPKGWEQAVDQVTTWLESSATSYGAGKGQTPSYDNGTSGFGMGTGEGGRQGSRTLGQGNGFYIDQGIGGSEARGYESGLSNSDIMKFFNAGGTMGGSGPEESGLSKAGFYMGSDNGGSGWSPGAQIAPFGF